MKLQDKIAVITGAAAGIGKAVAYKFASEGATVVIADIKDCNETVKAIEGIDGKVLAIKVDVSKETDVKKLVEFTVHTYGRLDIMVNNAGIFIAKPVTEVTEEEWDRVMGINTKGVFLGSKYAAAEMLKKGSGVIINIASRGGLIGSALTTVYCASKGGVVLFSKALSEELRPNGIRVNTLCPGLMENDMGRQVIDSFAEFGQKTLTPGWGKPEYVADAALFLASDDSSYITGVSLVVGSAGQM